MTEPDDMVPETDEIDEESQPDVIVPAIEATSLVREFGRGTVAVDGVDLSVDKGEIFGLVGPDGAGKSTLIRLLSTVLSPTSGDAHVFGHSVTRDSAAVKRRVGYMSQHFSLYPDLTVAENLRFFADLRGVPKAQMRSRSERLLEFSDLTRFADRQAQYLSGGMKQKLALAVTLMHEPDLLFLDEPTTGVDPVSRREFWRIIADLHRHEITVFVATPYMDEAERCTTVAFMDTGKLLLRDTPEGLKRRIPGRLIEISSQSEREVLAVVRDREHILGAAVQGDLVRALVADDGPDPDALAREISAQGVSVTEAHYGRIDMEAAFAYLAEETRAARVEDDDSAQDASAEDAAEDDAALADGEALS